MHNESTAFLSELIHVVSGDFTTEQALAHKVLALLCTYYHTPCNANNGCLKCYSGSKVNVVRVLPTVKQMMLCAVLMHNLTPSTVTVPEEADPF